MVTPGSEDIASKLPIDLQARVSQCSCQSDVSGTDKCGIDMNQERPTLRLHQTYGRHERTSVTIGASSQGR